MSYTASVAIGASTPTCRTVVRGRSSIELEPVIQVSGASSIGHP